MINISLFVSYKRGVQEELLFNLVEELKRKNTGEYLIKDISIDKTHLNNKNIFPKIKDLINNSNVVLAFITPEYLKDSLETIDEFVYAQTILKPFIYLKHESVDHNRFHYLNDVNFIVFNDESDLKSLARDILIQISKFQISEFKFPKKLSELLNSIRNHIDGETPEFRRKMAYAELKNSYTEIKNILTQDNYNIDIGLQKNYLYRAIPMFECANTIYAISKYSISDFWTSQAEVILKDYIEAQTKADKVYRIFVFENARQLNEYKEILNYQHQCYGNKGGVYFTSIPVYNSLFKDISDYDRGDFGLLLYNDIAIKARLNSNELSFQYAKDIESRIIHKIFNEKLKPQNKIHKWNDEFYNKSDELVNVMFNLFTNEQKKIKHIVLFQVETKSKPAFNKWLIDFKSNMRSATKWDSVSMLSKFNKDMRDHQYKGILKMKRSNYSLIFEFKNKEDLETYYNNEIHSIQREQLYKILNPEIESYYQSLKPCESCDICQYKCRTEKEMIYEKIEDEMQNFIQRIDFIDNEPLESIVNNSLKKITLS